MAEQTIDGYASSNNLTRKQVLQQVSSGEIYAKFKSTWRIPVDSIGRARKYPSKIQKTYVYFIKQERHDLIKIGATETIPSRFRHIQVGNPFELRLIGYMRFECKPVAYNCENLLKNEIVSKNKFRGEWFDYFDVNNCIDKLLNTYAYASQELIERSVLSKGLNDYEAAEHFKRPL